MTPLSLRPALGSRLSSLWHRARGRPAPPRRLALALQGGGSHGAFTWGVLDRLLDDERFDIASISGTSAGALNAAVLACGLARGGRAAARQALGDFWRDVAATGACFAPFLPRGSVEQLPPMQWASSWLRSMSPYDFNPLNVNPLRDVLRRHVDEATLQQSKVRLFVTATAVRTGRPRVFRGAALALDALLASACLPFLFQAVEIDGEPYWDGGYSGNPALYPLLEGTRALDLVLVKITPLRRDGLPRQALDIVERASEISFNASLLGELRAIGAEQKRHLFGSGLRLHMIADEHHLGALASATKLDTGLAFLERLADFGRAAAGAWLDGPAAAVGRHSSLDVEQVFFAAQDRTAPSIQA